MATVDHKVKSVLADRMNEGEKLRFSSSQVADIFISRSEYVNSYETNI